MNIRRSVLGICLLFVWWSGFGQNTITFEVIAKGVPEGDVVYVTGSRPQLGNWDPGKIALQDQGNGVWSKAIDLPKGIDIEYKFTLGSWEREAANEQGLPFANFRMKLGKTDKISHTIEHWKDGKGFEVAGQVTGTVELISNVSGEGLKPRDVTVWLPPGYDENPDQRFPVLYMHDGQNLFDPMLASYKVDWQVDETATKLIETGKIPPMIVVGMNNTADRNLEYSDRELGAAYRKWLIEELKPNIDKKYRTKPGREHTSVGGSSMGGLVSFILAWENPDVFSSAICMSPAFRIGREYGKLDYTKTVRKDKGEKPDVVFYIDNGGIGLEEVLQPGITKMIKVLKKKGFEEKKDLFYVIDPDAKHFESAWAERMPQAMEWLFGK